MPPFGPIYHLTPAEHKAVTEYVNSNLKHGHIHHSTSSAGAPVFLSRRELVIFNFVLISMA